FFGAGASAGAGAALAGPAPEAAAFAGRRLLFRSAALVPGVFQLLQAALVARYGGGTRLWHQQALAVGKNGGSTIVFVECLEEEEAGRSFVDVVVWAAAGFAAAAVAEIGVVRAVFDPVLYSFPVMRMVESVMSPIALSALPAAGDRTALPLAAILAVRRDAGASSRGSGGSKNGATVEFSNGNGEAVLVEDLLTPVEMAGGNNAATAPMAAVLGPGARGRAGSADSSETTAGADGARGGRASKNPFGAAPPPAAKQSSNPFAAPAPAARPAASPANPFGPSPVNPFAVP
ncbi:unnamed protein product, partial [Phaeothamnion confervicola]